MRIGGVSKDLTDDFVPRVRLICETFKRAVEEYEGLVTANVIFRQRTQGIGVLSARQAVSFGCSGPVLRGSGVKHDLRKDDPYSVYRPLPVRRAGGEERRLLRPLPGAHRGDAPERADPGAGHRASPRGPVMADVKAVRPPKGEYYARLETARGDMGVYFVSQGGVKPSA